MNTTGKVITGFLLGALAGAITGLLMAPATGKRTRKNLERKSKKLAKQVAGYMGMQQAKTGRGAAQKNGKASVESVEK